MEMILQAKSLIDTPDIKFLKGGAPEFHRAPVFGFSSVLVTLPMAAPEAQRWGSPVSCSPSSTGWRHFRAKAGLGLDFSETHFLFPAATGSPA